MRTKNADDVLLFQPFSCPMQIRRRSARARENSDRRRDTKKTDAAPAGKCHPSPDRARLTRGQSKQVNFSKKDKLRSAFPAENTAACSPLAPGGVPQASERTASTARTVQLLAKKTAGSTTEAQKYDFEVRPVFSRIDCSRVIRTCDQVYTNDVIHRQLHVMQHVQGHLPQSKPQPFLWKADECYPGKPRRQLITVGYRIQFPHTQKNTTDPKTISLRGHSVSGNPSTSIPSVEAMPSEQYCNNNWKNPLHSPIYNTKSTAPRKICMKLENKQVPRLKYTSACSSGKVFAVPHKQLNEEEQKEQLKKRTLGKKSPRSVSPFFGESPLKTLAF